MVRTPGARPLGSSRSRGLSRTLLRTLGLALAPGLAACGGGGGSAQIGPPGDTTLLAILSPAAGATLADGLLWLELEVEGTADPLLGLTVELDGQPWPGTLSADGDRVFGSLQLGSGSYLVRASLAADPPEQVQVSLTVPPGIELPDPDAGPLDGADSSGFWSAPLLEFLSAELFADFGRAVAGVDDLDGDLLGDLAIGVPGAMPGGAVEFRSGRTGQLLFTVTGQEGDDLGSALARTDDLDGDGVADLAVGAVALGSDQRGAVIALSGVDGAELWRFEGLAPLDRLGDAVAALGDVNGDGVGDVLGGARLSLVAGNNSGRAFVLSGVDGSKLHEFQGESFQVQMGTSVTSAGDVDGDGRDDFAIGSWGSMDNGPSAGAVTLYSGQDFSQLRRYPGAEASDHFGAAVTAAPDLDGDGVPDLVGGAPYALDLAGERELGEVRAYSGASGELLWVRLGALEEGEFGRALTTLPDLDGDGVAEILVGAPLELDARGATYLLSGADGTLLERRLGLPSFPGTGYYGSSMAPVGDLDGDGRVDWAVGAPVLSTQEFLAGGLFAYGAGGLGAGGGTVQLTGGAEGELVSLAVLYAVPTAAEGADEWAQAIPLWTGPAPARGAAPAPRLALGDRERAALDGYTLRWVAAEAAGHLQRSNAYRVRRGPVWVGP
jgi:hypothetical protein